MKSFINTEEAIADRLRQAINRLMFINDRLGGPVPSQASEASHGGPPSYLLDEFRVAQNKVCTIAEQLHNELSRLEQLFNLDEPKDGSNAYR